ncbi:hypothetical protein NC652_034768 [Populus alba x Populus x berolinensis]|nr:hypothetical protein NC652_034164 [Populus alba x Populus x berolinensis]KAJ6875143.1 hypothetical protein NC652_034768 [Populus alba x Populus x berolinensis]
MARSSDENWKSNNLGIKTFKELSTNSVNGEIDANDSGRSSLKMNKKRTRDPLGQTKSRSLTKKGGGKEFKPPSNLFAEKEGPQVHWQNPYIRIANPSTC